MRKTYLIIGLIICSTLQTIAQCGETSNGISTHPDTPINPQCTNQINSFDWRVPIFDVPFYQGNYNGQIPSPFFELGNSAIFELVLGSDFDSNNMLPEDGWELVVDGITTTPNNNTLPIAYFVLYNKFTSVLRVMAAHEDIEYSDQMLIYLSLNNTINLTGLLHPANALAQPLDQPSILQVVGDCNISGNNPRHFFYTDFQMGYDPCTCLFEPGTIQVRIEGTNEFFIHTNGQTTSSYSLDIKGDDLTIPHWKYLFNYQFDDQKAVDGAMIFNSLNELSTFYDRQSFYNSKLQEQNQAISQLHEKLDEAILQTLDNVFSTNRNELERAAKYTNQLSAALRIGNNHLGLRSIDGKVRLQLSNQSFDGFYTDLIDKDGFEFKVPGGQVSSDICNDPTYPIYNEVLGRFALMETPKVKLGTKVTVSYPQAKKVEQRFSFDSKSFQYIFNPAAKINTEKTKIYASLEVIRPTLPDDSELVISTLENIKSRNNEDEMVFASPFVPISCLENLTPTLNYFDATYEQNKFSNKVQLKLLVLYEFDQISSLGTPVQAFEVLTYPVELISTDIENINTSFLDQQSEPVQNTLQLNTTHFDQSQTIFAWDTIFINGDLSAAENVEVEIIAPNIILTDDSIGTRITLSQRFFPIDCPVIEPFDPVELPNYCKDNQPIYQANIARNGALPPVETPIASSFSLKSAPNPFSNEFHLSFNIETTGNTSLIMYNALGQMVLNIVNNQELASGNYEYQINGQHLPNGIYFVELKHQSDHKTIKVIKQ